MTYTGECIGGPGEAPRDHAGDPTRGVQLALDLLSDLAADRWHGIPPIVRERARAALAVLPEPEMRALRAACELMRDISRDYGAISRPEGMP